MEALTELERLVAIEDIKNLKGRRVRAVDTKDWATYEAIHAEDYVSDNEGDQRWVGSKANTERLARQMKDFTTVHHVHSPEITILDATHATGVWAMEDKIWWQQDGEDHWLHGYGFYFETYEKIGGTWLFKTRQLKRIRVDVSPGAVIGGYRGAER